MNDAYRAPADCPVCGHDLIVTRKGCRHCGTELAGEFASSPYDRLDNAEHEILRVFLSSRGNLREVEKHLQVSYPTARARFDALLSKLGMSPEGVTEPTATPAGDPAAAPLGTPQEQILARVELGEITPEQAAELIAAL